MPRRPRSGTLAALGLAALLGAGTLPAMAADDAIPRTDAERYRPAPKGWVDVRRPIRTEPAGRLRPATTGRTNIIVLMLDDVPAMDDTLWRRLPNISELFLDHGLRFSNYHGNDPLCCPGRANFLTGQSTSHHGLWRFQPELLDARVTVATELDDEGYYTFLAGKYLNGGDTSKVGRVPGWDRYAYTSNSYYHYDEYLTGGESEHHDDDPEDYQPDVAFDRALGFLRDAPPGSPLFGWITPYAVHLGSDPFDPAQPDQSPVVARRYQDDPRCEGLSPWRTPAHADRMGDRPRFQRSWDRFREGYDRVRVCRALLAVDEGLGRVRDELVAQGRLADTLLVLTADNGMGWGAHGYYAKNVNFATGMPLMVHWPDGRGKAPATDGSFVSNVDLAPTLCAVGGCVMGPYRSGRVRPDGSDFLPVISGSGKLRRKAIFSEDRWKRPSWYAVRTSQHWKHGRWHYTRYSTGERELYDLRGKPCWKWRKGDRGDPCELTNLAGRRSVAEIERGLAKLLRRGIDSGGAAAPFRATILTDD